MSCLPLGGVSKGEGKHLSGDNSYSQFWVSNPQMYWSSNNFKFSSHLVPAWFQVSHNVLKILVWVLPHLQKKMLRQRLEFKLFTWEKIAGNTGGGVGIWDREEKPAQKELWSKWSFWATGLILLENSMEHMFQRIPPEKWRWYIDTLKSRSVGQELLWGRH